MKFEKRQRIAIGFFFTFFVGIAVGYGIFQKSAVKNAVPVNTAAPIFKSTDLNLQTLFEVWDILQKDYADPSRLARETLVSNAVQGFVEGLKDPYTVFMDRDASKEFEENLNGHLEGIGALLEVKNGILIIVTPLKKSPAEKAGLRSGDVILKINGQETVEMALPVAVSKIRGKPGTEVTLTIFREENAPGGEPFDVTITRGEIEIESVSVEEPEPGIFWVQINQFSDDTADEFRKAVNEIILKKPRGVILDVRSNGGGYLDIAVDLVSVFLPERSVVVKIRKRAPAEEEIQYTNAPPKLPETPLVVLTNEGSASASEIVAGAIQDYKRGAVIGEKTFGKGTVQEIIDLKDGASLRMTTAKWYTPFDRNIDEIGLTPDVIVPFPKDTPKDKDPQLEEAIRKLNVR